MSGFGVVKEEVVKSNQASIMPSNLKLITKDLMGKFHLQFRKNSHKPNLVSKLTNKNKI